MSPSVTRRGATTGLMAALAGGAAVILLGLLTVGVQATSAPRGLPLAVAVEAGSSLEPVAELVAASGGESVDWQVVGPVEAARLLEDKDIYGYLLLASGGGGPTVTAVESGALLPTATQVADGVLRAAGAAVATRAGGAAPVLVQTQDPTSIAARTLPLAATSLLWIGGLVGSGVLLVLARRGGGPPSAGARLALVAGNALLGTLLVFTFSRIWDGGIAWNWTAVWFLVLVGGVFAGVAGAVLRLLGLAGLPILGLLYLSAPSVIGQPPELLDPAYRLLLWSWTPFRFASEALRSHLYSDSAPADVTTGWIVFGVLGAVALTVLLWPSGRSSEPASLAAGSVRYRARTEIVSALVLELIARRIEHGTGLSPDLTTAAARLAPYGGVSEAERARTAAREVLRPAAHRVLTGG